MKSYDKPAKHIIKQRYYFTNTGSYSQAMFFPIAMYGCERWTVKKTECQRTDALNCGVGENSFESPLDCKEIKPVNCKGNQSWIFIGRTDAAGEAPIFWPPDAKGWLIGKDPDIGKDGRQKERRMTEDEMFGQHHRLNWHEFQQAPGDGNGQGSLTCWNP